MPTSNLVSDTEYFPENFRGFSQSLQANTLTVPKIMQRRSRSSPFSILFVVQLFFLEILLLTVSLCKQQISHHVPILDPVQYL